MSANAGNLYSDTERMKLGQQLRDVGLDIKELLAGKTEVTRDEVKFLQVFVEVLSAVGLLFTKDDTEKLKQVLVPLSSYTYLLPYFLLIKSILENMQRPLEVYSKEHEDRVEWINKELARIAVEAAAIAHKLEDLGKSIIDIIESEGPRKAAKLQIFDFNYNKVSLALKSCISDMGIVNRKIDEGLRSIKVYEKVCRTFHAFIRHLARSVSPIAAMIYCLLHDVEPMKDTTSTQDYYNDQKYDWDKLDETLTTMKSQLDNLRNTRIIV